MDKRKEIMLNGFKQQVSNQTTISDLLSLHNEIDNYFIVIRNGDYVFPHSYSSTVINEGDKIEFVKLYSGG